MARRSSKPRGSSATPPAKKPSGKSQLAGGVGTVDDAKAGRYEFSRPEITDSLRKRMRQGKEGVHEATAAAAYQHLRSPDAGSRVYGKAFQALPFADQQALLSRLSPEDASVVQRAFADFVESEPQPESRSAGTREEKVRDVARKALQESQETVNLDAPSETPAPVRSVFSKGQIEYEDKVVNQPGPEWTKGQAKRGFRLLTIAPAKPGEAPRYVREVLPQVLEAEQQRAAPQPVSPAAGSVVQTPRRDRPDPNMQTIDRIMPTEWDSASEQTKRAVVEMNYIFDQIEEMEGVFELYRKNNPSKIVPEFLETAEGKRLAARMRELEGLHPEAVSFVEDDSLMTRTMPRDLVPEEEKLPREMTLSYHFGGTESQSLSPRWEERLDRRSQFNIPADAPNRMGWLQAVARQTGEAVDPKTGKKKKLYKLREGDPALEGGVGAVGLPYPTNLIGESKEVKAARGNLEFDPDSLEPEVTDAAPAAASPQGGRPKDIVRKGMKDKEYQAAAAQAWEDFSRNNRRVSESDINVTDEEIAAALAESDEFEDYDGMGAPVEDKTMLAESWAKPTSAEVLQYGTAEGSPSQVKKDRDFALREGMSMKDRLAEKLFRAAQEYMGGDLDAIASDRRSTGTISGYTDVEELGQDYLSRKLDGGAVRKKASASSPPREISRDRLLNLDGLVPVWRGLIEDVQDGQIIVRRPTAKEIAGFLVDRAGIPDPAVASRLEGVVQASMDDAEKLAPRTAKAKRLAGAVLPTGSKRAKNYIEPTLQQQRQVGDTRPRYSEEAQRLISESQARLADDGWSADTGESTSGGFVAEQASAEPAAALPVDPSAVAAFSGRKANRVQALKRAAAPAAKPQTPETPVKRLVIAGGREFADYESLKAAAQNAISQLAPNNERVVIVSGGARGADSLGEQFAQEMGLEVERYPADWSQGKGAGPARNAQMAAVADAALLMPGGRGTANMRQQMSRVGKPVFDPQKTPAKAATAVDPAAVAAFGRKAGAAASEAGTSRAGKGGQPPTNIAGLLAMLTGIGAGIGASGDAQAGEQPPLESLAMARRRSVSRITGSAAGAATPAPATPAPKPAGKPAQQQAPKGGSGSKPKPKPQQAAAATTAQTQPAPQQPAPAQTAQPQTTKPPAQPWFPNDPVTNFVRGAGKTAYPVVSHVGSYLPTYATGAALLGYGIPKLITAASNNWSEAANAMGMGGGQAPPQAAPAVDEEDPLDFLRGPSPAAPAQQQPPLNNSTSRIMALRQMLG